MTTILVVILLISGIAFYYYRKAKAKQAELRAKARHYYRDIRDAVLVWRNDKNNEEKISLALAALEIYDYWIKEAEFFPITFKQLHPEQFEIVDEWCNIVKENEGYIKQRFSENPTVILANEFYYDVAELREIRQQRRQM